MKKEDERAMEVTEMKMLRWSIGVTRKDRIRNDAIRGSLGVRRIGEKITRTQTPMVRTHHEEA